MTRLTQLVIQSVDGDAGKDANTLKMFKEGLASLGESFAASSESERVEALRKIESSAFFQTDARENAAGPVFQPHRVRLFRI